MMRRSDPRLWFLSGWGHTKLTFLPYPVILIVPLALFAYILRDRWSRFALLACAVTTTGLILSTVFFTHYAAPMIALIFVLTIQTMRHLRLWQWRGRQTGRLLVWTILAIYVSSFMIAFVQQVRVRGSAQTLPRARILAQLNQTDGRHVVVVRYGPGHSVEKEWVYNEADIDSAKVVWAREMDRAQNQKLFEYFRDHHVWLVEVGQDGSPPELKPYPMDSVSQLAGQTAPSGASVVADSPKDPRS
jgi:hypothetical protein